MENKNKGHENKMILEDFNCTLEKMERDGDHKTLRLIDAVPIVPCQNSSWIMSLRIYGEERTQIPITSPTTIGSLARIQDKQGL